MSKQVIQKSRYKQDEDFVYGDRGTTVRRTLPLALLQYVVVCGAG